MNSNINVIHVVLSLDFGGLERVVLDLMREGHRQGQRAAVVCMDRPGTLAPEVEALGCRLICLEKQPGFRIATVGKLAEVFSELRPDVVHTHQVGGLLYAGPAAQRAGCPLVVHTEHNNHLLVKSRPRTAAGRLRMRLLWRWAGRYAAAYFCVSRDVASAIATCRVVPSRKIHVVYNGIDTTRFGQLGDPAALRQELGIPPGAAIIGTVGRLSDPKRQDRLIHSFARLARQERDAHLLLVGDGPLRGYLRALTAELGLTDRVHFTGYQANPERFLQVMDVFALSSFIEGLPLAGLEAWAAGVPVVASKVGGIPEIVEDGRTGLLFDYGDDEALATALARLLSDRNLARRIGAAGQEQARAQFDVDVMASSYNRHYRALLARQGVTA